MNLFGKGKYPFGTSYVCQKKENGAMFVDAHNHG